ncbi:hypothetical protein FAES_5145 [Fibrella aestuarina BUZ 2]|uniref:Transposase IS200-like domain-containing protein n=1 Tax=Fibrella aestuarina BUZ 2 TaxID=1166018 RepID=I0KG91_9BACT|nr:hypothetical protein [Fibrella aestuarina]CCH03144.1 hypothetical protein FAES_5145 [Fibrella aestuarina BUZ 2]
MYNVPLLPGAYYHVYNHAVGEDNLFREHENYLYFLKRYADYITPVARTYAYCLMPNHFHFLIQTREEDALLSHYRQLKQVRSFSPHPPDYPAFVIQQFSNLCNGYAKAINRRYARRGALFVDYVRRKMITEETYFTNLLAYIHRNPVHHGFCKTATDWAYSSLLAIGSTKSTQLERNQVLDWFGTLEAFLAFHQQPLAPPKGEDWEFGGHS